MKNKLHNILSIFGMVVLFYSCSEDFVTKEFENGVVDENFFQNEQDAEQALTAVYDVIGTQGLYRLAIQVVGDATSDDINELTGDNGDFGTYYRAASDYRWEPSNPFSTARWYDSYKGINRAITLLEKLPEIDMDAGVKARMAGEAKFLRALYYFTLVGTFGDVPFFTSTLTREEYNELARTDRDIIYAQIEQDLLDAAGVLPVEASDPIGRATQGAANGLLSRVYLYQDKWQDAANTAEKVMALNYQLVPSEDYIKMFNGHLENGPESIFEYQSVANVPSFWSGSGENIYSLFWSPVVGWANWFSPSPGSYQQYEPGDIRRKASVLLVGADPVDLIDVDGDGVQEPFPSGNMNTNYFNNANVRKFLPEGKPMGSSSSHDVNYPIVRYAEVLLNYAEAQNELNNGPDALNAVNLVRERAKVPLYTLSDQATLRDQIRAEGRRELVYEGHRFFDVMRWNLGPTLLGPLGWVQGRHEFWPVPVSELDIMPNLTQYPQ